MEYLLTLWGECHYSTDLLFYWFGFSCFAYVELTTDLLDCLNPNQSNRMSAIDTVILPLNIPCIMGWKPYRAINNYNSSSTLHLVGSDPQSNLIVLYLIFCTFYFVLRKAIQWYFLVQEVSRYSGNTVGQKLSQ